MTATFRRIIITAIALIAIAGIACMAVLSGGCSASAGDPLEGARNGAVNTIIDMTGIKGRIDSELRDKADGVAEQLGIPRSAAEKVVDSLAIEDWKATSLPADAMKTGTYSIDTDDVSALITTYDDPSVVTVEAYGQAITFAVPKSAQGYVPYVKYAQYLQ